MLDTTCFLFMAVLFHEVSEGDREYLPWASCPPLPPPPPATQGPAAVWGRPEGGTDAAVAGPGASSRTIALGYGVAGGTMAEDLLAVDLLAEDLLAEHLLAEDLWAEDLLAAGLAEVG